MTVNCITSISNENINKTFQDIYSLNILFLTLIHREKLNTWVIQNCSSVFNKKNQFCEE